MLNPSVTVPFRGRKPLTIRSAGARLLTGFPGIDGLFRRAIWSRFEFPEPEMRLVNALPSKSLDIAVDVGAARGAYSWILSRKSRQVFAFEPGEQHSRYLESAIGKSNIRLVKAAVGSASAEAQLYTPGSSEQAPYLATLSETNPVVGRADVQVRMVQQVTLDSFFADAFQHGRRVDFLKVDVEGYELEVLKGAEQVINRQRPLIICEIEKRHNPDYGRVFALLRAVGYNSYILQDNRLQRFEADTLDHLQGEGSLTSRYVNNFVFQHHQSRIRLVTGR